MVGTEWTCRPSASPTCLMNSRPVAAKGRLLLAFALFRDGQEGSLLDLPVCFGSIPSLHCDMKQIFINSFPFRSVTSNQKKPRPLGQGKMGCRRIGSSLRAAGPAYTPTEGVSPPFLGAKACEQNKICLILRESLGRRFCWLNTYLSPFTF